MKTWDTLWINNHLATFSDNTRPYGQIANGAIAAKDGKIAWIGTEDELLAPYEPLADQVVSCGGRWITPGLIDCHTHLVFGGNRSHEFEERLGGASYEEIARRGGGINSTVRATRAASEGELVASAKQRLGHLLQQGVTTIEIKSGYGLDTATELRMLRAARRVGHKAPMTLRTTFLGAHAIPPEYKGRSDDYIDLVCDEMLPQVAKLDLADAVDAFCESIAFSPEQVGRVFSKARELGLAVKLHADQLSDLGGAALAAAHGALSADHLEYTSEAGVAAMAKSGTVAVLLPAAFYTLRETQAPPIDAFRRQGVPMAVATDCNPGSAPVLSLLLTLNMACTLFRLTPEEALTGATRHAARALGQLNSVGSLEVGKQADLAFWDIDHPAELCYWAGGNPCAGVVRAGKEIRPL